jgi:hypothetical protein
MNRRIAHEGGENNGNGNGLVVERPAIAIIAIAVVSAFSCVPA